MHIHVETNYLPKTRAARRTRHVMVGASNFVGLQLAMQFELEVQGRGLGLRAPRNIRVYVDEFLGAGALSSMMIHVKDAEQQANVCLCTENENRRFA
jgi:hypothetical protein